LRFQETKLWNICRKLMQSRYLYVKTMVSCRFSLLKSIEKHSIVILLNSEYPGCGLRMSRLLVMICQVLTRHKRCC
jgi:hypothetical protein